MEANTIDQLFSGRSSVRSFTEAPITDELFSRLFEMTSRASTTGNMQLYAAVVTRDAQKKAALAPAHFNQPAYANASAVVTFCADFRRFSLWAAQNDASPDYTNFHSFMVAAIDALIAAQTFCMAAESQGLGICYLGTVTYNADKVIDCLRLPQLVVPVATISVGYPKEQPQQQQDRLPLRSFVHYEEYADFAPEEITSLYAAKEDMAENKQFVADNGLQNLAQVYTRVRYTPETFQTLSAVYRQAIARQGFTL